ncbi:uncharacterized protein LOC126827028 isoform X1 [Patella vulgata]|uniref:uncharacterized protein LOC126827028 isoform X1 n=3 Tax=Patella vulgata TaxID=6465 RepID=UPI00217F534C|nr:uncharacterized protein LOC126827028 isoform X1 [Patella vulgata]
MGKRSRYMDADLTFVPKISATSQRIALEKRHILENSYGIPHFMLETKSRLNTREPLGPIVAITAHQSKPRCTESMSDVKCSNKKVFHKLSSEFEDPDSDCAEKSSILANPISKSPNEMLIKKNQEFDCETADKNVSLSARHADLDTSVFTFKPSLNMASIKIAETLNSDFMSRQQQHIENQRKHIKKADHQFKKNLTLSPHSKRYSTRIYKDNDIISESESGKEKGDKFSSPTNQFDSKVTSDDNFEETLNELEDMPAVSPLSINRMKTTTSPNLQRLLEGPYANHDVLKSQKSRFNNHGVLPRPRPNGDSTDGDKENDAPSNFTQSRSKTMPTLNRPKAGRKMSLVADGERLRNAKEIVEKAIKFRKIFTIQGGYASIRQSLRKRGWVEKFYKTTGPVKRASRTKRRKQNSESDDSDGDDDDDDDDDDDGTDDDNDEPKIPPWEEDDGIYGIMSRMVRNVNPVFFWVLKRDVIDYRFLLREQMVNHYCKAGSFTTKVGLCVNLRNVRLFDNADQDSFCPRCYRLSHEEDKEAFTEDYRLSACMNIVKIIHNVCVNSSTQNIEPKPSADKCVTININSVTNTTETVLTSKSSAKTGDKQNVTKETVINEIVPDTENLSESREKQSQDSEKEIVKPSCKDPKCAEITKDGTKCVHLEEDEIKIKEEKRKEEEKKLDESKKLNLSPRGSGNPTQSKTSPRGAKKKKKKMVVPVQALELAVMQCEKFLRFNLHEDIDETNETACLSEEKWDQLLQWYYNLAHDDGVIMSVPQVLIEKCDSLMNRLKARCPQFELDGVKNVWIVKPGAKSRGRGIVCYDKLEDMLKLVSSQVVRKDSKYVVQKYIERPLLIYNTKFDIRQWFLVTDWNPLTIYFYQDSYLRFCSQQYTLDDFDESIHLSNNAIQKHYKNGPRSTSLPSDNMWTHEQFKDYLKSKKQDNLWEELIYPGMKKAIQCALLTAQDLIEYRKSSFELYGADFMLTENYHPWLIEINSSPSMEASTAVTARMCNSVLDDTIKVVIDRKHDRNCDIGRFELAFKQPVVSVPPYIGINLQVDGQAIKKPIGYKKPEIVQSTDFFSPKQSQQNLTAKSPDLKSVTSNSNNQANSDSKKKETVLTLTDVGQKKDNVAKKSPVQGAPSKSNISTMLKQLPKAGTSSVEASGCDYKLQSSVSDTGISRSQYYYNQPEVPPPKVIKSGGANRVPEPPSHPKVCLQTPYMAVGNRRIVSKTSVSVNYNIPGIPSEKQSRAAAVTVKNVETTDLRNVKGQKGRRRIKVKSKALSPYVNRHTPLKLAMSSRSRSQSHLVLHKLPVIKVHIFNRHG